MALAAICANIGALAGEHGATQSPSSSTPARPGAGVRRCGAAAVADSRGERHVVLHQQRHLDDAEEEHHQERRHEGSLDDHSTALVSARPNRRLAMRPTFRRDLPVEGYGFERSRAGERRGLIRSASPHGLHNPRVGNSSPQLGTCPDRSGRRRSEPSSQEVHDMTTTAASRQALGAYGETLAARLLTARARDGPARPQLAVPRGRARPGAARRRRARRVRGQDAPRRRAAGRPTRRSTTAGWSGCTGWSGAGQRSTTSDPERGAGRPGRRAAATSRRRRRRPRRGAGLMPFATSHTVSLTGAAGPPHRRPGRRVAGPGRHRAGRTARRRAQRSRATGAGWPSSTAGSSGPPRDARRSCSRRPTCPSAAPTTTWPSRWRCSERTGVVPTEPLDRVRSSAS